jgi:hypothetical protein
MKNVEANSDVPVTQAELAQVRELFGQAMSTMLTGMDSLGLNKFMSLEIEKQIKSAHHDFLS